MAYTEHSQLFKKFHIILLLLLQPYKVGQSYYPNFANAGGKEGETENDWGWEQMVWLA